MNILEDPLFRMAIPAVTVAAMLGGGLSLREIYAAYLAKEPIQRWIVILLAVCVIAGAVGLLVLGAIRYRELGSI